MNWNCTRKEHEAMKEICDKAEKALGTIDRMSTMMDLEACHSNGCPLDFEKLAKFDTFNLLHDVCGIARHLDRKTGKLKDCFLPRAAK